MSDIAIFGLGTALFLMCIIWTFLTIYAFSGGLEEDENKEVEKKSASGLSAGGGQAIHERG